MVLEPMISKILKCLAVLAPLTTASGAMWHSPSHAATVCSTRTNILNKLSSQHGENPVAMGLAANGSMLEVLASNDGTWTILITSPNGTSCVVAVGDSWEALKVNKAAEGGPAA